MDPWHTRFAPKEMALRVLSCLRRYFAESAATLACMVFGVRDGAPADAAPTRDYWITDGAPFVCCPNQAAPACPSHSHGAYLCGL